MIALYMDSFLPFLSPSLHFCAFLHFPFSCCFVSCVSEVSGRQHLRSASRRKLNIPRFRRSTFGTRAFSVAGPTVWNSLPDSLRDPASSLNVLQ